MSKRDALVEITSKMPFVGRHIVRPAYLWGREAARDGDYVRKAASGVFLGAFALLHAQQAKMGIDATIHNAHDGGVLATAEAAYDALYTIANTAVTYTQARLFGKLAMTGRQEAVAEVPVALSAEYQGVESVEQALPSPAETSGGFTRVDYPRDLAFTLGGQMLFLATLS